MHNKIFDVTKRRIEFNPAASATNAFNDPTTSNHANAIGVGSLSVDEKQ